MSEAEEFNTSHLLNVASFGNLDPDQHRVIEEAADEIENLRNEVESLKLSLKEATKDQPDLNYDQNYDKKG